MLNSIIIMGRLTADPELRTTSNGTQVCRITVAVDRPYAGAGKEKKTDFINVTLWRQNADYVCKYFRKGSLIAVQGSLQINEFTDKNNNKRHDAVVVATSVTSCGQKNTPGDNSVSNFPPTPTNTIEQPSFEELNISEDDLPF